MAINVKDPSKSAKKFVSRAAGASQDYKDGVSNAGGTWEAAAKASNDAYKQGVQAAIADDRFSKGVNGAGGKFQTNAVNLGSARYAGGVQNAEQAYQAGVAPYFSKLASLTLPPKGMRGSPSNQQRANIVATELNKLRLGK